MRLLASTVTESIPQRDVSGCMGFLFTNKNGKKEIVDSSRVYRFRLSLSFSYYFRETIKPHIEAGASTIH